MSTRSATVAVRMPAGTGARPEGPARHALRATPFLAGETTADHDLRQAAIAGATRRGAAGTVAGCIAPRDEATARIRKTIADASRK